MSDRIESYARQFEAVNDETVALVTACSDEQWRQSTASEGWSVGVVAHHAAEVNRAFVEILERIAAGDTYSPSISTEELDRQNAQHAEEFAAVSKQEVLDLLDANGIDLARAIRSLREDQLEGIAGTFGDMKLTVSQVIEWVIIGHPSEHLNSILATIGAEAGVR